MDHVLSLVATGCFRMERILDLDLGDSGFRQKFAHVCYLQAINHQSIYTVVTVHFNYQNRNILVS